MRALCVALLASLLLSAWAPAGARADAASDFAEKKLEGELREAQKARASITRLYPMLVLGAGIGAVVLGTIVGTAKALSCSGTCVTPPWVGGVVVGGAGAAAAGATWLVWTNHRISQLDSRLTRIENDLEAQRRREHAQLDASRSAAPLVLTLRFSF